MELLDLFCKVLGFWPICCWPQFSLWCWNNQIRIKGLCGKPIDIKIRELKAAQKSGQFWFLKFLLLRAILLTSELSSLMLRLFGPTAHRPALTPLKVMHLKCGWTCLDSYLDRSQQQVALYIPHQVTQRGIVLSKSVHLVLSFLW